MQLGHQFRLQEANMEISHKISHNLWIWLFYYIQIHPFCFAFEPQIKSSKKTFNHFHLRFPWSVFCVAEDLTPQVPTEEPHENILRTFSQRWDKAPTQSSFLMVVFTGGEATWPYAAPPGGGAAAAAAEEAIILSGSIFQ